MGKTCDCTGMPWHMPYQKHTGGMSHINIVWCTFPIVSDSINFYINFYLLFFIHVLAFTFSFSCYLLKKTDLHTVKIIVCTMLCKCFYMQQEIQEMLRLCILILWHHFFLNLCSKLSSVILLNYKKSNWFCFLHKSSLGSPQTKHWVDWRKYT